MPGLLGKKLGMANIFDEQGKLLPVTAIELGPCKVVNVKTKEKDGYEALQLGFGERKAKHTNKPLTGYFKNQNVEAARILKEFKNFNVADYNVGDTLTVELFAEGDKVTVKGTSKGKGFQGVMKRHGFGGVGGTTHGQGDRLRAPGSIGQSSYPSRVLKGTRMAGRTGGSSVTVKNLKVVKVFPDKNIIFVKGAVPGAVNSIVEVNK
ncbi:MAG: 50S ribosomal protein L3 [Ignavibacteria bacterium]|nr:MAG: 50S ribosomal protein L3 [Ignavibacteria bacterium]